MGAEYNLIDTVLIAEIERDLKKLLKDFDIVCQRWKLKKKYGHGF